MSLHLRPREGWSTLALLLLMLLSVAWSIQAANWSEGLWTLQPMIVGAVVLGWILASIRRLPGTIAHLLSLILGIGWLVFVVAWLLPWDYTWPQAIQEIYTRFMAWVALLRSSEKGTDNLVFVMQLGFLMWIMAYSCTWSLVRNQSVWGAIVPSGFAMVVNLYYAPPEVANFLVLFVLTSLLLIIRSFIYLQEQEWRAHHVGYNPDIGFDFLRDGLIFAIIVVLIAWFAPSAAAAPRIYSFMDRFEEPWNRAQAQFNRLFSSLNYRPRPGPAYFSNTLTLSGPVNLGDTPVFDVRTPEGRYWRTVVYDQYTGRGWVNTDMVSTLLGPSDPRLANIPFEARKPVTQTITILQGGGTVLPIMPQPQLVSLPVQARHTLVSLPGGGAPYLNVSMLRARRPLQPGQSFEVVSSVSVANTKQLREAGTDYPDWVVERYLQLPDTLPPRVKELAYQIAGNYDNPYDQVTAIERYLRKIKYNEQIEAPPPGRDGVDYFLFDLKEGYCDYYASALVVMARVLGIPARLAAGYSRGEYISELGVYRQREYDAHSWPEVFFPKYGWIEFEPTAADPLIVRPEPPKEEADSDRESVPQTRPDRERNLPEDDPYYDEMSGNFPVLGMGFRRTLPRLWTIALAFVFLGVISAGAVWMTWLRAVRGLSLAGGVYARMVRLAELLGIQPKAYQTPYEYAEELGKAVPEGRPEIHTIADVYVEEQFSGHKLTTEKTQALYNAWRRLRQTLLRYAVIRALARLARSRTMG